MTKENSLKSKYILLVEDNPADVKLTLRAFKKSNILNEVVVAEDGARAIEILFSDPHAAMPQIVLLDLKLPKVDGMEVLKRIRSEERSRLLPVIILTSSREESDLTRGYGLGANSYVRKPVDFEQFQEAVRQLGLYWLVLNETPPEGDAHLPG
jgi:two-component system, response regulator